jgi:hypothetical protein
VGVVVERVGVRGIGSKELLDVDECFGVCHLNCRSSDASVYAPRMICRRNVPRDWWDCTLSAREISFVSCKMQADYSVAYIHEG